MQDTLAAARSVLFVPGDRPDRFDKAAASGADAIILDLEDAVAGDAKTAARDAVDRWLGSCRTDVVVRINGTETDWHSDDLAMLAEHRCAVMVPKAHSVDHLAHISEQLGAETRLVVLLETALGIMAAHPVCAFHRVVRAAFGSVDLGAELGIDPDDHGALQYARSAVVMASAAADLSAPLDGVTAAVEDEQRVAADSDRAARSGFGGKLCIHPRQVAVVNSRFTPSELEIAWAHRVLHAASDHGAHVVDGRMVDKPVVDRAMRIMTRSGRNADRETPNE